MFSLMPVSHMCGILGPFHHRGSLQVEMETMLVGKCEVVQLSSGISQAGLVDVDIIMNENDKAMQDF